MKGYCILCGVDVDRDSRGAMCALCFVDFIERDNRKAETRQGARLAKPFEGERKVKCSNPNHFTSVYKN